MESEYVRIGCLLTTVRCAPYQDSSMLIRGYSGVSAGVAAPVRACCNRWFGRESDRSGNLDPRHDAPPWPQLAAATQAGPSDRLARGGSQFVAGEGLTQPLIYGAVLALLLAMHPPWACRHCRRFASVGWQRGNEACVERSEARRARQPLAIKKRGTSPRFRLGNARPI